MICQSCGQREASVLVQTVTQNQVAKAALCSSCASEFQPEAAFDALTVLENVAMPLMKRFRLSRQAAQRRARAALVRVHAAELEARMLEVQAEAAQGQQAANAFRLAANAWLAMPRERPVTFAPRRFKFKAS